ncbi:MAG: outer membrane beta-barrel protein, partial [Bacteroidetes bacterium]|nr:outer membrane beta-barrel protein [Bacteroidota bacterium]
MKLPKIISLFVFTFFALVSIAQKKEIPTRYALCPGFNVSNLYNDSSRTVKTTYPQFGFIINKDFNSAFGVNGGMQFSYRGANREGLSYKFRNTYLDFQVIPKYSLFDFLKLEIGGQYSYLMTSKLITRTPFNGKIKTDIYGKYKSQFELIAG